MRAPVVEVRAGGFQPDEAADSAVVKQLLRLQEWVTEAPLVVEGELHAVLLAGVYHALRVEPGRRHGLFAVNRLHARLGDGDHDRRVRMRPRADAHEVRVLGSKHLVEVEVCVCARVLLHECVGVLLHEVGTGDDLAVVQHGVSRRMVIGDAERHLPVRTLLLPYSDDGSSVR